MCRSIKLAISSELHIFVSFSDVKNASYVIKCLDVIVYVNDVGLAPGSLCQQTLIFQTQLKAKQILEMPFLFNLKVLNYILHVLRLENFIGELIFAIGPTGKNLIFRC